MAVVSLAFGQTPGVETKPKTNPLVGKWKANLSKSQRDPNHQFQSLALRFEISDDALLLTFTGISMSGKEESGMRKLHPDGKERPVAEAHGIVEVSRWVGSHTLESVAKKDGTVRRVRSLNVRAGLKSAAAHAAKTKAFFSKVS
jgi:hypothetical protein